jgi:hypothetical protein
MEVIFFILEPPFLPLHVDIIETIYPEPAWAFPFFTFWHNLHFDDSGTAAALYNSSIFIREKVPHILKQKDVPRTKHHLICCQPQRIALFHPQHYFI